MNNMDSQKPIVAHVMRGFLKPTETFIGNQIFTLSSFKPIVLCHHRFDGHSYPLDGVTAVTDLLPASWQMIDNFFYRVSRVAIPPVIDALARYALEHDVQLLHFHYLVDARFFLSLKRKTGLPGVVSGYGYDVSSFPRAYAGYGKLYLRPLFEYMDYFIAMSQDMRKDLVTLGCSPDKIIVHYYGTDTRRFAFPEREYIDKDEVTILACGALEIKKAQHLILQALWIMEHQKISSRRFRVKFVGDGPMRPVLEQQVNKYGWQDKVNFLGHVPYRDDRLIEAYRQADIFSLPSITIKGDKEGIPGTIIEAMAAGLPIVSTYHAGIPEIIKSSQDGILVQEGDVEAMAQAFADLINDVSLREKLGRSAAKRAANELDLQQGTVRLEGIYNRILGE